MMNLKAPMIVLVAVLVLHCTDARSLHKRAAFYIANETACVVDNIVYYNGDPIPTDDPCEACKCRPPGFACVLRECETKPGCRAVRRAGHCCPEYVCGCEHNGRMYRDGDEIRDSQNPCYTCHCQGSAIACAFVDCFFRIDCVPDYVQGECCPRYDHCSSLESQPNTSFAVNNGAIPTIFSTLKPVEESTTITEEPQVNRDLTTIQSEASSKINDNHNDKISDLPPIVSLTEVQTESPVRDNGLGDIHVDPTSLFYIPREGSDQERTSTILPTDISVTSETSETDPSVVLTGETTPNPQGDIEVEKSTTDVSISSDSPQPASIENASNEPPKTTEPPKNIELFVTDEIQGISDKTKDSLLASPESETETPSDITAIEGVAVVTTTSIESEVKSSGEIEKISTTGADEIKLTSELPPATTTVVPLLLSKNNVQEEKSVNKDEQESSTETRTEINTVSAAAVEKIASTSQEALDEIATTTKATKDDSLLKSSSEIIGEAEKVDANENVVGKTTLNLDKTEMSATTASVDSKTTTIQSEGATDQQTETSGFSKSEQPIKETIQTDNYSTVENQTPTPEPSTNESSAVELQAS